MSKKIHTIGYRNGLFVGQVQQLQEDTYIANGVGLVLDDMFITCLSSWYAQSKDSTTKPKGPALLLYPHKQILYADQYPFNNKLRGIWCFVVSNIKIFGNGQDSYLAVLHTSGQIISKIKIKDRREIEQNQEIEYNSQEQKWNIIQQIIGCKVPDSKKQTYRFIEEHFQKKIPPEQRQAHFYNMHKRNEDYFGIISNNQGLIFSIKTNEHNIEVGSIGYYNEVETEKNMQFGRVYLDDANSSSWRIEEGNYENNQIYEYESNEKRPLQSVKTSRNYFRQATAFSNKFLQFSQASEVYERLTKISKQYTTKISSKYGQRIIEGNNPNNTNFINSRREREEQKKRQINKQELYMKGEDIVNREYNLQQARANIEKMINRRKNDLSTNKRTANFIDMPNYYNQDDENSHQKYRFQDKSNNKDISPMTKSIYNQIGGIGGTSRAKSPRRSSPKKYTYTDLQSQAFDQRKQKSYPQFIHNDHFKEQHRKIYTVNEFTLYQNAYNENKNEDRIKQQREKILKDLQNRKQRTQVQRQKPNILTTNNRQILRQTQNNVEIDPFSYRNPYKMFTQNVQTYPQTNRYYPNHYEQMSMVGSAGYKRKFFNNYNYMEDKGAARQNPSPIKASKGSTKIDRPVVTTITKISNYETRDKSPLSMKPTARKIYSYMD